MRFRMFRRVPFTVALACLAVLLFGGLVTADDAEDPILPTGGSSGLVVIGDTEVDPGDFQGMEIDAKDALDADTIADGTSTEDDESPEGITDGEPSDPLIELELRGVE